MSRCHTFIHTKKGIKLQSMDVPLHAFESQLTKLIDEGFLQNFSENLSEYEQFRGISGENGGRGEDGMKGDKGDRGEDGKDGMKGDKGDRGEDGKDGMKGDKGDRGEDGKDGMKGDKGDRGEDGKDGMKGDKGDKGDRGEDGKDGMKGDRGNKGEKGDKGDKGDRGENGVKGKDGAKGKDGVVDYPINAPIDDKPMFSFSGSNSGLGYSDAGTNGNLLLIKNGIPRFKISDDYIDICNSLSQIKHKKIVFNGSSSIFMLKLTSSSCYMINIRVIITSKNKPSRYYQGIATVNVDSEGDVSLNIPSESVFSSGFSWNSKIGPNLLEFFFTGDPEELFSASGRIDILSSGDTSYECF